MEQCQKGEVVAQRHPRPKAVAFAQLFAQRAINAAILLELPHFQFRLKGLYISKHPTVSIPPISF